MSLYELYRAAALAHKAATEDEVAESEFAQSRWNVFYCVDRYLADSIPSIAEDVRTECAREIADTKTNGESVIELCRKFARTHVLTGVKSKMLEEKWAKNDVGNGERFAFDHADWFKFLDDRKIWMRWDGKRWRDATNTEVARAAKMTAKRMLGEALQKVEAKEAQTWALSSLSHRGLLNMIACASSEKVFRANASDFDRDLDLLTVLNGTVDLRTGRLYQHAREDLITTLTEIAYDPSAKCPRWDQFLLEVFDGDEELVRFTQRAVGYSLTGHTREHAFFLLHGTGRNGKGRYMKTIMSLVGDAARATRFQTFSVTREQDSSGNTPALAALAGARLVVAGEPDEGVKLSESVINSLTGDDPIQVCRKHEHPFTFLPHFKIWLHGNYKPIIRSTADGIWSRPRLIPFGVGFMTEEEAKQRGFKGPRKEPDRKLDEKLAAELPGILAWAVRGAVEWYVSGLGRCASVDAAMKEYQEESDRLKPFLDECVIRDPGGFVTNAKLCEVYSAWCRQNLVERPLEGNTLSKELARRGYERGKNGKDQRGFKDISVVGPMMGLSVVPGLGLSARKSVS